MGGALLGDKEQQLGMGRGALAVRMQSWGALGNAQALHCRWPQEGFWWPYTPSTSCLPRETFGEPFP